MTVEAFTETPAYVVTGTGPYAIGHAYLSGAIVAMVQDDDGIVATLASGADYSVAPEDGASGNLTLTAQAATDHAGKKLFIDRVTAVEQGFAGQTAREEGMEANMDRSAMALQELRIQSGRSLRTTRTAVAPFTPADGRGPIWDEDLQSYINGPTSDEIASAQAYAEQAVAAAEQAVNSVTDATTINTNNLFSGDGVTTTFNLSVKPQDKRSVDVYFNGIAQYPLTYSVTGTVLTFGSAPPLGTNNIFVKIKGAYSGTVDARDSTSFPTRMAAVAWMEANTPPVGTVASAENMFWFYDGTSTAIEDMPGWRPYKRTTVNHFAPIGIDAETDTAAIQAAVDYGGDVYFTSDLYEVTGEINVTKPFTRLYIEANSTVRQTFAPDVESATINFRISADYSGIFGPGTLDLNRSNLTWPATKPPLRGVRSWGTIGIQYGSGLKIIGAFRQAIYHGGAYGVIKDVHIKDCGRSIGLQKANYPTVRNVLIEDIGNNGNDIYQHCMSCRHFIGGLFENIRILNYQPDAAGLEPNPNAFAFEGVFGFEAKGIYVEGFSGTSPTGLAKGFKFDNCVNFRISIDAVIGYPEGGVLKACSYGTVYIGVLDGQYKSPTIGTGLTLDNGGLQENNYAGAISQNSRSVSVGRSVTVYGGVIRRFFNGVYGSASYYKFVSVQCLGSVNDGWRFGGIAVAADYQNIEPQYPVGIELSHCSAINSGRAGLYAAVGSDVTVHGGTYKNNGQNTVEVSTQRVGIGQIGTYPGFGEVKLFDALCEDDQTWSHANALSFVPGASDADNRMEFVLDNPTGGEYEYGVGQYITLKNLTGSDETGKIHEAFADTIVVEFSGAVTAVDTGNLTALTGTVEGTIDEGVITGTGTAFDTEVKGSRFAKIAGVYYRISGVESATSMRLFTPLEATISGETVEIVAIDVDAIQSQTRGIYFNPSVPGPFHVDAICRGNTTEQIALGGDTFDAGRTNFIENLRVSGKLNLSGLSAYADNAAAVSGGLDPGEFYIRSGHGLDIVT